MAVVPESSKERESKERDLVEVVIFIYSFTYISFLKNLFPFENSVHCSQRKKREGFLFSSRWTITSSRLWQQESVAEHKGLKGK